MVSTVSNCKSIATFFRVLAICLLCTSGTAGADDSPLVAAASSLQFALEDMNQSFEASTGKKVRLTFGSSGNLARQIRQGAPYDLYLSANEAYPTALYEDGVVADTGVVYATGRLAFIASRHSQFSHSTPAQLEADFEHQAVTRFSIANPEHAPYGIAARQALEKLDLWTKLSSRLVIGENVAQGAQFVASGNADFGLTALSLAQSPQLRERISFSVVPQSLHRPIKKRMVLINQTNSTALEFMLFIGSERGKAILNRHGFFEAGGR